MRTVATITNPSGYPYQWAHQADYAPRDGYAEPYATLGNPITMRVVDNRDIASLGALFSNVFQRGMQFKPITYPYDFSDRSWYTRNGLYRAPYGL